MHNRPVQSARRAALLAALAAAPLTAVFAQETAPTAKPDATVGAKTLSEADLYGYWGVDADYVKTMTEELKKAASANDKSMEQALGQGFLQMILQRAARQVVAFSPDKTEFFEGTDGRAKSLKIKKIEGNVFELEADGRPMPVVLVNGRLAQKSEYDNREKRPPMYMRRLSDAETTAFKAKVEAAKRPPAADAPPEARLKFLVYKATPEQVDELLRTQKDLATLKTPQGDTALATLLTSSTPTKLALAEKLLAAGAEPNPVCSFGNKPLLMGLFSFNPDREKEFIKLLVKHGVKIDTPDAQNETPLMNYCHSGRDTEFLKWMLDTGADLNRKSKWGNTPLRNAMQSGWAAGATVLIDRGADIQSVNSLLTSAVQTHSIALVRKLAEKGLTQDPSSKQTALISALEEINFCTSAIESWKKNPRDQETFIKKKKALIEFLPALIEHDKTRLETMDAQGKTALAYAKDIEVAKALLDAGASLKCGDRTPLHIAAHTSPELIRFYVAKGLDVNALTGDRFSCTPLQVAVGGEGSLECIKALLEAGADINRVAPKGNGTVITSLLKYWKNHKDSAAYFDYLVSKGADLKICGADNIAAAPDLDMIRRLAKAGASVQPPDSEYAVNSPLSCAIMANDAARVKLLLELGADPNWKGKGNESALERAKQYPPKDKSILEMLSAPRPAK